MQNWHVKLILGGFATKADAEEARTRLSSLPPGRDVVPNVMHLTWVGDPANTAVQATFVVEARDAGVATVRTLETLPVLGEQVDVYEVNVFRASPDSAEAARRTASRLAK